MWPRMNERDRWSWEGPIPSAWDNADHGMRANTRRAISIMRWTIFLLFVLIVYIASIHDGDWTFTGTTIGLSATVIMTIILIGPHWVATARGPTHAQAVMLNQIASVSEDHRRQIQALVDQDELTFARAKRICRENVHLRDEAERRRQEISQGPQMNCDITDGAHLVLQALGRSAAFVPCVDGWYRLLNQDERLHRMLCAGAAGSDAGLYWIIDHRQGVWGVPACFMDQLQARLDAMGRMTEKA